MELVHPFPFIGDDIDPTETDYAFYMIPPVAGFFLGLVQHRETGFVTGADGIQFVTFPGAVEIQFPVLEHEIDRHGIRIPAVTID